MNSKKIVFNSFTVTVGDQSLTWNPIHPHLTGDEELIQRIGGELALHEGFSVTPTGPFVESDVSQAPPVYLAVLSIFGDTVEISNPPDLSELWLEAWMLDENGNIREDIVF